MDSMTKDHINHHAPVVAIVGRPNVGKSSLFNAILRRRAAIVSDISGTTRDRVIAALVKDQKRIIIADTGGLVPEPDSEIENNIASQVDFALLDADIVIFVVDVTKGITYADESVANRLRQSDIPVILAANKTDGKAQQLLLPEFFQLAIGEPFPVSAYHRNGVEDLIDKAFDLAESIREIPSTEETMLPSFAIVGRPNVGKSSIANSILGEQRSIVSAVPGTTRDSLDAEFEFEGKKAVLVDTAGIRRRGSVKPGIEKYSVLRSMSAVDRSDVAIIILDAMEIATSQDLHIAGLAMESFKGVVVVVNKADVYKETFGEELTSRNAKRTVLNRLHFMDYVPVVVTSALENQGVSHMLRTAFAVYEKRLSWAPPAQLTRVVMDAIARHLPPKEGRRVLKIYRVKQESIAPPTFVFYCNNPSLMHFSYERYLENEIRKAFDYEGTHLRLEFRGKNKLHVIGGHRTGLDAKRTTRRTGRMKA